MIAAQTGVLDTKNLKGELDDGVEPLTADEVLSAPTPAFPKRA